MSYLAKYSGDLYGTDKLLMIVEFLGKLLSQVSNEERSKTLLALSSTLSDARTLLRFNGLFHVYTGFQGVLSSPPKNQIQLVLQLLQNTVNLIYFPLEHTAYLSNHKVISVSKETIDFCNKWTGRCWFIGIVLSFVRLYMEFTASKPARGDPNPNQKLKLDTLINFFYFPLAYHAAVNNKLFSVFALSIFGLLAAFAEAYKVSLRIK